VREWVCCGRGCVVGDISIPLYSCYLCPPSTSHYYPSFFVNTLASTQTSSLKGPYIPAQFPGDTLASIVMAG